jgi:hypothetical protein
MGWNKDGHTVKGLYLNEYPVTGVVKESRVKYGGEVSYWIDLEESFYLFHTYRDNVILSENELTHDFGILQEAQV